MIDGQGLSGQPNFEKGTLRSVPDYSQGDRDDIARLARRASELESEIEGRLQAAKAMGREKAAPLLTDARQRAEEVRGQGRRAVEESNDRVREIAGLKSMFLGSLRATIGDFRSRLEQAERAGDPILAGRPAVELKVARMDGFESVEPLERELVRLPTVGEAYLKEFADGVATFGLHGVDPDGIVEMLCSDLEIPHSVDDVENHCVRIILGPQADLGQRS